MSWVRWSAESDLYIFEHVGGYIECCGCPLGGNHAMHSYEDVIEHLSQHLQAGHRVPASLIDQVCDPYERAYIERVYDRGQPIDPDEILLTPAEMSVVQKCACGTPLKYDPCNCCFLPDAGNHAMHSYEDVIEHLSQHLQAGHTVPIALIEQVCDPDERAYIERVYERGESSAMDEMSVVQKCACGTPLKYDPCNYVNLPDGTLVCEPCFDREPYAMGFPEVQR